MGEIFKLSPDKLKTIRKQNPMLVSYNVEFAEVTGGTFWKAYTPEQIAGTEEYIPSSEKLSDAMQVYPPIDLYNKRCRKLAKELGQAWIRVSGTWATKTYYDFENKTNGIVPEGYLNILTREQWVGVLDFVKAVGGKLLVSVSNCEGVHKADDPWSPKEAEKLFSFSQEYGCPIEAVEFTNEPNLMQSTGFPKGYTTEDFRRDHDIFAKWLRKNYPDCLLVGPSITAVGRTDGGVEQAAGACDPHETVKGLKEKLDIFSYHCYTGLSARVGHLLPIACWKPEDAVSDTYLNIVADFAGFYGKMRDIYVPDAEMWVTETGDAGGGGNTWASTYLDVIRTLNEFGIFSQMTNGVLFHNTLASSAYGYLAHGTFLPRPSYFAALLWTKLMGNTVYDTGVNNKEGIRVYAHSRKDEKDGVVYLIINNSVSEYAQIELPKEAVKYSLSAQNRNMRSEGMCLNGMLLELDVEDEVPKIHGVIENAGNVILEPLSCTFFVM